MRAPSATTAYRTYAKAVVVGGKRYAALTTRSTTLRVVPQQEVVFTSVPDAPTVGSTARFGVRVTPGREDQTIWVERETATGWKRSDDAAITNSSGVATVDVPLVAAGTQRFRASVEGTPATEVLVSPPVTVEVAPAAPRRMTRVTSGSTPALRAISPDGDRVLWQRGGQLQEWRYSTRTSQSQEELPFANALVVDVTPDLSSVLLTDGFYSRLSLWDRRSRTVTDVLEPDRSRVSPDGTLSDDGRYVAFEVKRDLVGGGTDSTGSSNAYLWDASTNGLRTIFDHQWGPDDPLVGTTFRQPAISGDGRTVFINVIAEELDASTPEPGKEMVLGWDRATGGRSPVDYPLGARIDDEDAVSRDGGELVLYTYEGVVVHRSDGSSDRVPVSESASFPDAGVTDISADGETVVYVESVFRDGDDVPILWSWPVGAPIGQRHLVSAGPGGEPLSGSHGLVSDDGSKVAFVSSDDPVTGRRTTGSGQVFYADADAG